MSRLNTRMYEIPMIRSQHYHIINNNRSVHKRHIQVIMTEISDKEEELIDELKDKVLKLDRGDRTFSITMPQIFCYGEVDFHSDEDLSQIDKFNFLSYLDGVGIKVSSNYNYDTHSSFSPKKTPLWTETFSPAFLSKFAHAALGKPKRIIIFKQG